MFRAFATTVALLLAATTAQAESITVSAAVSLKESLLAIAKDYQASTGDTVEFNFGASGQLMLQIQQGAPVDSFISAAQRQVAQLRQAGLLANTPERIIARNHLVLIVPAGHRGADSFQSLGAATVRRIAIGQPRAVPAGEYAAQVFQKLQIEAVVKDRLIYGANVRQVLDYVIRGEVDAGIVYSSDAFVAGDKARVVAIAADDWHDPIDYPVVVLKTSQKQQAAERFISYLMADRSQAAFLERGFVGSDKGSIK
jgi:molybdate transport system substrate-binding protein